jgi:hypothetical protein
VNRRVPDARLAELVADYRALDLDTELARSRADYAYARGGEQLAAVPGWTMTLAYATPYGSLYRLRHAPGGA